MGSFSCTFENLQQYPFDTETCSLDLKVVGNAYKFTKLIPKDINYKGAISLSNYIIKGHQLISKTFKNGKIGIQIEITLGAVL